MGTLIHLVRHGQTEWNAQKRLQGHTDIPLNNKGLMEARALSQKLFYFFQSHALDKIYSSDLLRAMQTAVPFAKTMGYGIIPSELLRERSYGSCEGTSWSDFKNLNQRVLEEAGAESQELLYKRCDFVLNQFSMENKDKTLLLFTHAGFINMLVKVVQRIPPQEPPKSFIVNASLTTIYVNEGEYRLERYNETNF